MIFSFLCIPKKPRENCFPKEQKQKSDTKHETEHICKGAIIRYGVTPQVYQFNKLGRKWNFTAGSTHILIYWVTLIHIGFENVVVTVNVNGLEHATGHWTN